MGTWERLTRTGKKLLGAEDAPAPRPAEPAPAPASASEQDTDSGSSAAREPSPAASSTQGLSGWIERRAARVVQQAYESRAVDIEERVQRALRSAYESSADDIEERAVRAMRRALESEAQRIKEAIEHGIAVKKREVRLSLLVLVVSSLVYLALYWFTSRPPTP